jgi:perosamine synthetase
MTDVAAALGRVQLGRADELLAKRRRVVEQYDRALCDIPGLELPREEPNRQHAWHLYAVKLDVDVWRQGRDRVTEHLRDRGIGCSVHWMPLHMHPYYRETFGISENAFPVAASLWPRLLTLPLFPDMTDADVALVATALRDALPRG